MGRRVVQPVRRAPEPERGIALLRRQERPQTPNIPPYPPRLERAAASCSAADGTTAYSIQAP
ncbi:hypothetical protein PJ267_18710 [Arthrobacter sp. OVS8]|nr:hypothetical protein PJ267_18710 [Arthrobacter sp. OVS8]